MNTTDPWIVRVPEDRMALAAELRLFARIEAAFDDAVLWLRGEELSHELHARLAAMADGPVFRRSENEWLIPISHVVPTARMPQLSWKPLRHVLGVSLPVARMPAFRCRKSSLQLTRSATEQPATVLVTDWITFRNWALTAPAVRLESCRFALENILASPGAPGSTLRVHNAAGPETGDGLEVRRTRVVIVSNQLPPLTGERFSQRGRVALPLGWTVTPTISERTLNEVAMKSAGVDESSLLIWSRVEDRFIAVQGSSLLAVTRANVRASDRSGFE